MTEDEADMKIKHLKGPFARATDRMNKEVYGWDWEDNGAIPRYYVGWSPCFGNGATWEEAFADLQRSALHPVMGYKRFPRRTHKCAKCRAPKEVLKRRSMRYEG